LDLFHISEATKVPVFFEIYKFKYNIIGIKVKYIKVKLNEMVPRSFKVFEDENIQIQ
jgi:hypothetical protein